MPTLNWIGKDAVVKHHKEVPFRLLEPVPELSCGPADAGNLIVQGAKGKVPAYKRYKHLLRNDGVVPQTLDDDLKAELPLKRVWMVAAQDAE